MPFRALLFALAILAAALSGPVAAEERRLSHDGRERRYLVRKPMTTAPGALLPTVIVLHGGGGAAEDAERMTGFTAKIGPEGVLLVYPDGTGPSPHARRPRTWNAGHCCGYAMRNEVDDVGYVSALIDEIVLRDGADPDRIYVAGMSNGAMMAHRLGVELSAKIAAIAPVAGGLFGDEPPPANKVPALIINGALDTKIAPGGGETGPRKSAWDGTPLTPAAQQGAFWASANGCRATPWTTAGRIVVERFDCPPGGEVERLLVTDNGHAWPGGERGARRSDAPSTSLDATRAIWAFFARQSR